MKEIFISLAFTFLEFAKYIVAYKVIFNLAYKKQKWRYLFVGCVAVLIQAMVTFYVDMTWMEIIYLSVGILIPILLIEGKMGKKILAYIAILFGISIVDMGGGYGLGIILGISISQILSNTTLKFIGSLSGILVLVIILIFRQIKRNKTNYQMELTYQQYFVVIAGTFSCTIILGCTQYIIIEDTLPDNVKSLFAFAISLASIAFIILSIWQSITLYNKTIYKNKNEFYEEYFKLQENHIRSIIEKDAKIRSFRHDLQAHLLAIKTYCNENNINQLKLYLDNIEENSAISSTTSYTGNIAVDAIIDQLIADANKNSIKIHWKGAFSNEIAINTYDLCTIFSNIIKNAIEACEKVKDCAERNIYLEVYEYDSKLYININNPVAVKVNVGQDGKLKTTKGNKEVHGLGILNVRKVVDKYKGKITYDCKDNLFDMEILI